MFAYAMKLTPDDGGLLVTCPDLPELTSSGETEADALVHARDALVVTIELYIDHRRTIPTPRHHAGLPVVSLLPRITAKAALYQAMRERGLSNVALANALGVDERQIRRLLDFGTHSRFDDLAAALDAVGLSITVERAA